MHWSEEDILAMPSSRRKWYVERLKEQKEFEYKEVNKK
jgi:hypothetical protein